MPCGRAGWRVSILAISFGVMDDRGAGSWLQSKLRPFGRVAYSPDSTELQPQFESRRAANILKRDGACIPRPEPANSDFWVRCSRDVRPAFLRRDFHRVFNLLDFVAGRKSSRCAIRVKQVARRNPVDLLVGDGAWSAVAASNLLPRN